MSHQERNISSHQHDKKAGTAIGAASGLAVGAIAGGAAAGTVGAVAGAAVGGAAGGLAMRLVGEDFDGTHVDNHWRTRFHREPYYESGLTYEDYAPAYRLGAAARARHPDALFEDAEAAMEAEYPGIKAESRLAWERAKEAARASFHTEYF